MEAVCVLAHSVSFLAVVSCRISCLVYLIFAGFRPVGSWILSCAIFYSSALRFVCCTTASVWSSFLLRAAPLRPSSLGKLSTGRWAIPSFLVLASCTCQRGIHPSICRRSVQTCESLCSFVSCGDATRMLGHGTTHYMSRSLPYLFTIVQLSSANTAASHRRAFFQFLIVFRHVSQGAAIKIEGLGLIIFGEETLEGLHFLLLLAHYISRFVHTLRSALVGLSVIL